MCKEYNEHMRQYKGEFWCIKHQDGIYSLVNHNLYMLVRKEDLSYQSKELIHINGFNEQCLLYQVVCINSSTGKINNRLKALEELGVEISNVTKADGEIMFSFEPKDLTSICSVFKIKKKIKSKMTEEQKQIARDRLKEAREHKDLTP